MEFKIKNTCNALTIINSADLYSDHSLTYDFNKLGTGTGNNSKNISSCGCTEIDRNISSNCVDTL